MICTIRILSPEWEEMMLQIVIFFSTPCQDTGPGLLLDIIHSLYRLWMDFSSGETGFIVPRSLRPSVLL